jgi:hypothetical protein
MRRKPKDSTKCLLGLISEFSKEKGTQSQHGKSVVLLHANSQLTVQRSRNLSHNKYRKIKCLEIYLNKEIKVLYNEMDKQ